MSSIQPISYVFEPEINSGFGFQVVAGFAFDFIYNEGSRENEMSRKIEKTYTNLLSNNDRIKIRQVRGGRNIIEFSVQYEALVNSRWRRVTRYDNAHGYPHRHVYYPYKNKEYKYSMNTTNNNDAFTESQLVIKKNFVRMRESYIILMTKMEASHE